MQAVKCEEMFGGVFVAIDSNLGAVTGKEERAVESIPVNEGRLAQAWVNVRGGMHVFSVFFWLRLALRRLDSEE